jgi:hypothetical protein
LRKNAAVTMVIAAMQARVMIEQDTINAKVMVLEVW